MNAKQEIENIKRKTRACLHSVSNFLADVSVAWSIVCSIAKARVNQAAGARLSDIVCNGLKLPKPQFKYHITHR